ncbi:hypothetical protein FB451DRAFT_1181610 [Mycena latifolia]|nr:hypothetical protein FB451DRAFT_1181610 [Mycena latifolia]
MDQDETMPRVHDPLRAKTVDIQLLRTWMEGHSIIAVQIKALLRHVITNEGAVIDETFSAIQGLLSSSPIQANGRKTKAPADLKALWVEVESEEEDSEEEEHAKILNDAFIGKFEEMRSTSFVKRCMQIHYGKIIASHGPSGAGKSRGVDALQEMYPTFSICFRGSNDPSDGWPPGDGPAYQFFQRSASISTGEERVAAFLGAFLEIAATELEDGVPPARSAREIWRYKFQTGGVYEDSARGVLFTRVARRAQELLDEFPPNMDVDDIKIESERPLSPSPSPPSTVEPEFQYRMLWKRFCEVPALKLIKKMPGVAYCFIALDECTDIPCIEPILLRRILEAGHHIKPLWFILLGTNAKIQSLVPTSSRTRPSARFARLQCLPAWCYFGYEQLAPPEPDIPRSALQVEYLRRVGRPQKLFSPQQAFDPNNAVHVLTAFSHRILVELGSTVTAHQMAADSVNSNLRYATRIDGEIVRTVCPSEPLLSLISTDVMNKGNNFVDSLRTLIDAVKKATIDRGQEGELYCRLLLIRARDVACQRTLGPRLSRKLLGDGDAELDDADHDVYDTFSQRSFVVRLITLKDHLDALVHLENIKDSAASELRSFAKQYHVNITHMIQFRGVITDIPQIYLCRLFIRGAAVQCCHNQPVIDGFYVGYKGDLDKPFDLANFIVIAWQSRAKAAAASQGDLVATLTGPMQIDPTGKRCKPAQIVILMDLNTKAAFKGSGDPFLQITKRQAKIPIYPKKLRGSQTPWVDTPHLTKQSL